VLQRVEVASHSLESYAPVVGDATLETLRKAAEPLQGFRIAHINATAYGGGVSELLHSLVPLDRALGIDCEWLVIPGTPRFFEVTKRMHNALQGEAGRLSGRAREVYLEHSRAVAALLEPRDGPARSAPRAVRAGRSVVLRWRDRRSRRCGQRLSGRGCLELRAVLAALNNAKGEEAACRRQRLVARASA